MSRIFTRTGDDGTTSLHGGLRTHKTDIRIEANGCLDETNVEIGALRLALGENHHLSEYLRQLQIMLMDAMSAVATPSEARDNNPRRLPDDAVALMESRIDALQQLTQQASHFILPGGSPAAVAAHRARVAARRAERRLWQLHSADPLPPVILQFINRLSDLMFAIARLAISEAGGSEECWKSFSRKES